LEIVGESWNICTLFFKTSKNSGFVAQKIQLLKYSPDSLNGQPVLARMLTVKTINLS